jgi:hypothetical protein
VHIPRNQHTGPAQDVQAPERLAPEEILEWDAARAAVAERREGRA